MKPRRPAGATLAGLLTSVLLLATPGIALGATDWTITRSPSSIAALTTASFSLVATNTGSGKKTSAIGCITVSIPSQFAVNSAAVTNASGHIWNASFSNSGGPGTTVTVRASASKERLTANNVESVSFSVNVTAALSPGSYQWTANAFNGHDCSGTFGQPTALTVTIGAGSINTPPVAVADLVTVPEGGTLVTAAPGLLANDLDADGDPLTAQLVTGPVHGTLSLAADGSFTYAPFANFAGADSFTYRARDGFATSAPATVSITVVPVAGTGSSSPTPTPSPSSASPGATPAFSPGSSLANSPTESATPGLDGSPPASPGPAQITAAGGSGSPAPTPALTLARAPNDPIAPLSLDFAFAGMQFDWFIPGLAIGGPGLLVIAAIAVQLFGALAWLPAVRRYLGGSDPRRRRRPA
jgi:hypothetical protein